MLKKVGLQLLLIIYTLLSASTASVLANPLADAINEANANPGKRVTVIISEYTTVLADRLPAIKQGANLSIVSGCKIHSDEIVNCIVQGNGRDPIFHADKSARHCQLYVESIVFQFAKGAVFLDLPCTVRMKYGGMDSIDGPAVYSPRSLASFSFLYTTFTNCSHTAHGGAVVLGTRSGYLGNHYFEQCRFRNNYAAMGGGAVFAAGQGTLRMADCVVFNNSAKYKGGGVFLAGPSFLSIRNTIKQNVAMFGPGGGIFSIGQPVNPPRPTTTVLLKLCGDLLWRDWAPHVPSAASMGLAWNGTGAVQLCRMEVKEGSFPRWKGWEIREGCEGCPGGVAQNYSGYY